MLNQITPVLLTFNEAPNIGRTLAMLTWAADIVLVDSFSTDQTIAIATQFRGVRVFQRPFDSHANQWNYALKQTEIRTKWVLALDADYVLSTELVDELRRLRADADVAAFRTTFRYCIQGKQLRGTIYPPVVTLYRHANASYHQDGHTQRVRVDGRIGTLQGVIFHDDRKPLAQWCMAQSRYMELQAAKLRDTPLRDLGFVDRLRRKLVITPVLMFAYCAFIRGNIFDGKAGLYYILQRTVAELLLSLHLLHLRITR